MTALAVRWGVSQIVVFLFLPNEKLDKNQVVKIDGYPSKVGQDNRHFENACYLLVLKIRTLYKQV